MKKWSLVTGWFGEGIITDIAEADDLVRVRQGKTARWMPRRDVARKGQR